MYLFQGMDTSPVVCILEYIKGPVCLGSVNIYIHGKNKSVGREKVKRQQLCDLNIFIQLYTNVYVIAVQEYIIRHQWKNRCKHV